MLREAVRALCEDKIAPLAAEVDETGEFPQDVVRRAASRPTSTPSTSPRSTAAPGADALATCIVIEEVARVCASSSLIPAVNKLGTMPLILAGVRGAQGAVPAPVATGEAMFSLRLSEPEAGCDAAAMKTRAVRDGDDWVLNGVKRWITNAGVSEYYTVMAVTDPEQRAPTASRRSSWRSPTRASSFGAPEKQARHQGLARPARSTSTTCRIPADRMIGAEGTGFATAMRTLDHTRVTIARPGARHRAGRAGLRDAATSRSASSSASRSPTSRACSSCSPTWP